MLNHPAFLSLVSGLVVVGLVYYIKKNQKEEQYNNGQFGLLFLVVSGLVYGSCFIADGGLESSPSVTGGGSTSLLSDCSHSASSSVFTGTPEF